MGTIIGIMARKNGKLCFEQPIMGGEDTSLSNSLIGAETFGQYFLETNRSLSEQMKEYAILTSEEIAALKLNYMQELADEGIEYNDPVPEDFRAIGTRYDEERGEHVYDPKYKQYENWVPPYLLKNAMGKIGLMLQHRMVEEIRSHKDYDDTKADYDNLGSLLGIMMAVESLYNPDEIALVLTLF